MLASESTHTLSESEIERLASMWYADLLSEDEESRIEGFSDSEYARQAETLSFVEGATAEELAKGRIGNWLFFEMDDYLESHGIKVERTAEVYRKLALHS